MNIAPAATISVVEAITRQMQASTDMQMSLLKQMADSQQQMAEMLHALGVGLNVDIQV